MSSQRRGMAPQRKALVFLIMQFLDEENFRETVQKLGQESGIYLSMNHLEKEVMNGNWDEVEKYLSAFTSIDDSEHSRRIFLDIREVKYLEALDKHDWEKAVDILSKELKVFAKSHEYLYGQLTELITLKNFRENKRFADYKGTESIRKARFATLKSLIERNPLLSDKLKLPSMSTQNLRTAIIQSIAGAANHMQGLYPRSS